MSDESVAAERLLLEVREEVARADNKASLFIAAVALVLAGSAAVARTDGMHVEGVGSLLRVGVALVVLSMGMALVAVFPRVGLRDNAAWKGAYVVYFRELAQTAPANSLNVAKDTGRRMTERNMIQAVSISRIVLAKYRWLSAAMVVFFLGLLVTAVAVLARL